MGIKQFFEKQGGGPDNICDIRIEAKKKRKQKELAFDPETEITEMDWEALKNALETAREGEQWDEFLFIASSMKVLRPERFEELNIDEVAWRGMKALTSAWFSRDWWTFSLRAMRMKILCPERASELKLDSTPWHWQKTMEIFDVTRKDQKANYLQSFIMTAAILYPKRIEELKIHHNAYSQKIKDDFEEIEKGDWATFDAAKQAMAIKIVCPEIIKDLKLDEAAWREMKKVLKIFRRFGLSFFAAQAMAMKILAAHKVEVTENGLEITMRPPEEEEYREEREPRPVRRTF